VACASNLRTVGHLHFEHCRPPVSAILFFYSPVLSCSVIAANPVRNRSCRQVPIDDLVHPRLPEGRHVARHDWPWFERGRPVSTSKGDSEAGVAGWLAASVLVDGWLSRVVGGQERGARGQKLALKEGWESWRIISPRLRPSGSFFCARRATMRSSPPVKSHGTSARNHTSPSSLSNE
jgi:hypothetical protein